jgi:hypothetical protein
MVVCCLSEGHASQVIERGKYRRVHRLLMWITCGSGNQNTSVVLSDAFLRVGFLPKRCLFHDWKAGLRRELSAHPSRTTCCKAERKRTERKWVWQLIQWALFSLHISHQLDGVSVSAWHWSFATEFEVLHQSKRKHSFFHFWNNDNWHAYTVFAS